MTLWRSRSPGTQKETGEIGAGLATRQVRELPVIDRNAHQLVELQSGITPPYMANPITNPERNRYFAANGQSPFVNMCSIDGVSNWEPYSGHEARVLPEETIQTIDVLTTNDQANLGFAGGGQAIDRFRPGANDWHGSLFEARSGDALQSRNVFDPKGLPQPRFVYNQMGAARGGSVVKDRTFVFGSDEGTFQNGGHSELTTVPTPAALTGNFSGIPESLSTPPD